MKCSELTDRILLDYLYGKLDSQAASRVEEHRRNCELCSTRIKEIGRVLRALDGAEGDLKVTSILEIAEDGSSTAYMFVAGTNSTDRVIDTLDGTGLDATIDMESILYVLVGGEEARVEPADPADVDGKPHFKLYPAVPIEPGERMDILFAAHSSAADSVKRLDSGEWDLGHGKLMMDQDYVYVMAVRLPTGAQLTFASPDPSEVRRNGATTVVWTNALPANKEFEFSLRYRL